MTTRHTHSMAALVGAAAMTLASCSADVAEQGQADGGADGQQAVKVMFAFNVPYGGTKATRMTGAMVQDGVTADSPAGYRGMQDINIMPLPAQPLTTQDNAFPFENVSLTDATVQVTSEYSANFYKDVNIPVGTSSFLFYGEAQHGSLTSQADMFDNGILDKTVNPATNRSTNDVTFSLRQIASDGQLSAAKTALLAILNDIAGTEGWGATAAATLGDADYALGDAYKAFTAATGIRCGSAGAIRLTVQALYNRISRVKSQYAAASAQAALAQAILTNIENHFDVAATGETGASETSPAYAKDAFALSYKDRYDEATTTFPVAQGLPEGAAQLGFSAGSFSYVDPKVLSGVATTGVSTDRFCYPPSLEYFVDTPLRSSGIEYQSGADWPAQKANEWENDDNWTGSSEEWTPTVTARTKSIALRNNIYYGVSRLVTTVRCAATSLTDNSAQTDGDDLNISVGNADDIAGADPATLKCFLLTGIMVGSQPKTVGWNFLPTSTSTGQAATTNREQVVYDRRMNTKLLSWVENVVQQKTDTDGNPLYTDATTGGETTDADGNTPIMETVEVTRSENLPPIVMQAGSADEAASKLGVNHTLLLDNFNPDAATQDAARICIELENHTGQDFYGQDGLVLNGQKFYLVGELAAPAEGSIAWVKSGNASYTSRFPQYGTERAFVMDYTTQANLVITDLKKAYVTIPDLRVPKLSLGLSVDLTWRPGITYQAIMDF
ncbi:MAG: hypothetical protein K5928_00730 [Prevotella sp.]|nr:hypothetical protein [Prevotella sp.]